MGKRHQKRAQALRNARARSADPGGGASSGTLPTVQHPPEASGTDARAEPPGEAVTVLEPDAVGLLAGRLLAGTSPWPVVVVTVPAHREEPYVDVAHLLGEVRGLAEVVVLPTGAASWAFAEAMPAMTQAYGGASRVYAPDLRWVEDPYASPLRFVYSEADGHRTAERLADDVFALVGPSRQTPASGAVRDASGMVLGTVGSRAIVQLDDGGTATIWAELTVPGVAAEQLFAKGQRVTGGLDPDSRRLDVSAMVDRALEERHAEDSMPDDVQHVPVRVEAVDRDGITVALFPGETVTLPWSSAGGRAQRAFYERGDVTVATWWLEGEQHELRLGLWSEDEDVDVAPAVLPGGPPWLELADPDEAEPAEDHGAPEESTPVDPADPAQLELAVMRRGVRDLRAANEKLRRQIKELRRRGQRSGGGASALSPEEAFRYLVYAAWVKRFPLDDRKTYPLRDFQLSARFLGSVDALESFSVERVADVVMEVVSGRAPKVEGRDRHPLRIDAGGDSPAIVDPETGATCFRVALQRGAPSARRLHYWENTDGTYTLERVVLHEEFKP